MIACVTGADRGLGRAITEQLLAGGCQVFAGRYGIEPQLLDNLKAHYGDKLQIIPLDVSQDASVQAAAEKISRQTDRLDVLINNAAVLGQEATLTEALDFQEMLTVYNVNAVGPLRVSKAMLDLLARGSKKLILNVSSGAGSMAHKIENNIVNRYAYCGSKAALNVQSIMLQNQVRQKGIRVYLLEPGWMRTYMTGEKAAHADVEPEVTAAKIWEFIGRNKLPDYLFHDLYADQPYPW